MLEKLLIRLPEYQAPVAKVDAAVLMALTREDVPRLILTRRAQHMNSHAGEVAFPGGKCDSSDASIIATALREAHEEIALEPSRVQVVGELGIFTSRIGMKVKPIIGLLDEMPMLQANPDEIESIFTVPFSQPKTQL